MSGRLAAGAAVAVLAATSLAERDPGLAGISPFSTEPAAAVGNTAITLTNVQTAANTRPTLLSRRIAKAQAIANAIFGDPCDGNIKLFITNNVPHDLVGEAVEGPEEDGICRTRINPVRLAHLSWAEMCETVIHETGEINGEDHSSNPNSSMYGDEKITIHMFGRTIVLGALGDDPRCKGGGVPYLKKRGRWPVPPAQIATTGPKYNKLGNPIYRSGKLVMSRTPDRYFEVLGLPSTQATTR